MNIYEGIDFTKRITESTEIITGEEAEKYAHKKDDRSLTTRMVALDIICRIPVQYTRRKILEVCCGTGDLTNELYQFTENEHNIIGTDGSDILIKEARSRYPQLNFQVMDVHAPSQEKYDLVVCKDAFHHFHDSTEGLLDMLNRVSPGGYLYIFDLNRKASPTDIFKREKSILDPHSKRRFLQSVNASLTLEEFSNVLAEPIINSKLKSAELYYPFQFSEFQLMQKENIGLVEKDQTGEHKLNTLFAVYVLRRKE